MPDPVHRLRPAAYLLLLLGLLCAACAAYLTLHARGQWDFILALRGKKLLLLLVVAYAIGVSALIFQTLTHNPILTPGLLGYDALHLLLQTLLVWLLGATGFHQLDPAAKFALQLPLMLAASWLLFQTLTHQHAHDLTRMILTGVIFGVLFRSLNGLLQRLLDPARFVTAQTSHFASFTTIHPILLLTGLLIALASAYCLWRMRHALDLLLLGRNAATALGLDHTRTTRRLLLWSALLVSTATALVGPASFFGLLVCALVNTLTPEAHHRTRLPAAFLTAALILVTGQTLFEHLLHMQAALSVLIEFAGGILFLWLVLRRRPRP